MMTSYLLKRRRTLSSLERGGARLYFFKVKQEICTNPGTMYAIDFNFPDICYFMNFS